MATAQKEEGRRKRPHVDGRHANPLVACLPAPARPWPSRSAQTSEAGDDGEPDSSSCLGNQTNREPHSRSVVAWLRSRVTLTSDQFSPGAMAAPTAALDTAIKAPTKTFEESQPSLQPPCVATFPKANAKPTPKPIHAPLVLRLGLTLRSSRTISLRATAVACHHLRRDGQTLLIDRSQGADQPHRFRSAGAEANPTARLGEGRLVRTEDAYRSSGDETADYRSSQLGHGRSIPARVVSEGCMGTRAAERRPGRGSPATPGSGGCTCARLARREVHNDNEDADALCPCRALAGHVLRRWSRERGGLRSRRR